MTSETLLLERPVYLDGDGNWVAEFTTGEVARSTNKTAIEALLDYAENKRCQTN